MKSHKLSEEISLLRQELEDERAARQVAERLLEDRNRELYQTTRKLKHLNESLEKNVLRRTSTLTSLIKNLHAGVLLEDEHGRVILINEKFCELFGIAYNPGELIGQEWGEATNFYAARFEDPEHYNRVRNERIARQEIAINEVLKMKDGRVLERDFLPIRSGNEYLGHLWQYRDITEQFHFEVKLRQSEEKYRGMIEHMELGLMEVDSHSRILKAYGRFCEMSGYTEAELVGKTTHHLFPDESPSVSNHRQKRIRVGMHTYEARMRKKNGEIIWVLVGESPFYDEAGRVSGTIGIHYDITSRKQLEHELREAREIAEQARDAEKEFLANMSHEIRNPINAIAGIISLLYDTRLSDEQLEYLNNIKYAADVLLGLISDILDLSKIEAGKMVMVEKPIELNENIRAIVQTYNFKSHKDIVFSAEIDPRLAEPVLAAPTVINQILLNLIGNAVKFTERGEIKIRSTIIRTYDDCVEVETSVRDTGIGISEDQLEKIFESFHQADQQIKLKYGGTGLGLAIVQRLVGFYDGTVRVDSREGVGSTFTFTLKLRKATHLPLAEQELNIRQLSTDRIHYALVVEDNMVNQQYLIGLLRKWKIRYDLANNGEEALEYIEQHVYDLVLMDIRMPVMDGYEATIRIRNADHNPNRNVPIVALTASALVDEKERALAAGMNFHLTKPFSPDQLLHILDQLNAKVSRSSDSRPVTFQYSQELDSSYLQDFYEDDHDRAALMFQLFLNNIDKEIADMKSFFSARDWENLALLAHRIKPNFSMVGLTGLTDRMQEVDRLAKAKNAKRLGEIVPDFFSEFKNKRKLVERELILINAYISHAVESRRA